VCVVVSFGVMRGMNVVVKAMVSSVVVGVRQLLSIVFVRVFVLVPMLVAVGVRVLVAVHLVSMAVLMGVGMAVLVGVQMLVLVVALHYGLLSWGCRLSTQQRYYH
jgi:hypothetical protein